MRRYGALLVGWEAAADGCLQRKLCYVVGGVLFVQTHDGLHVCLKGVTEPKLQRGIHDVFAQALPARWHYPGCMQQSGTED